MEEESIFSLENLWLAKLLQKIIQDNYFWWTRYFYSSIFGQYQCLPSTSSSQLQWVPQFITSANHSRRATQASLGHTNAFLWGNTNLQNDSILPTHFVAGHISRNSSLFQNHLWEIKTSHKDSPSVPCISIPPSNHS